MKLVDFVIKFVVPDSKDPAVPSHPDAGKTLEAKGQKEELETAEEVSKWLEEHPKVTVLSLINGKLDKDARASLRQTSIAPYLPLTETPEETAEKSYILAIRSGLDEATAQIMRAQILKAATDKWASRTPAAEVPAADAEVAEEDSAEEVPADALTAAVAEAESIAPDASTVAGRKRNRK